MRSNKRKYIKSIIALVVVFGAGVFTGNMYGMNKFLTNNQEVVEISRVVDLYSKTRSPEVSFNQFWAVWDKIKAQHVDSDVDDVDLFYGAISGLVKGLDDPYSVYFPPKEAVAFSKDISGNFEGIGAEIGIRDDVLTIVSPLPESPAQQSGILAGDKIMAIDGESTVGISVDEAVMKIRGKKGTEVVLTIQRDKKEFSDISIVRDTIKTPTVQQEVNEDGIAYIRIYYFNEHTAKDFTKVIKEVKSLGATGLVIDLRGNPGGLLRTSVEVASEWLSNGDVIVKETYNNEKHNQYQAGGAHRLQDMPTVVLIDKGTASGAEIVAGALQDYDKATVIGMTSFGKGSVQDFEVLPDGSALKLTVAKWFTPLGRSIDGQGVTPDILIEDMYDEKYLEQEKDVAKEKAFELLTNS